jgi:hypothetical protein
MRQLAVVRSYNDLVATLRARRDQLDVPHEILDEIAGLASGHTSKLLAPSRIKYIGDMSWHLFEVLGLKVVVIEDPAALARMRRRSAWRTRRQQQSLGPPAQYPQSAA